MNISPEEKTEVIYGDENIIDSTLKLFSVARSTLNNCLDSTGPSMDVIPGHPITRAHYEMKERGVRIRYITEITKENVNYCKELMNFSEVRHLDEVKGNFGVLDGIYYRASAKLKTSSPPPLLISSTVRAFVEQQEYFFDMLWKKAIPAKQRIKEIEQGVKREFMDTIQDPYEIQKILVNLLKSATEEILVILPTITNKRLHEYEHEYMLHLLKNEAKNGVKIRILVNEPAKERIERELSTSKTDLVELRFLDERQQIKVMTIIADKDLCLTVEVKDTDDDYGSVVEVLGLATFSNSESTVLSYASIFETLWIQAELNNNKKNTATVT